MMTFRPCVACLCVLFFLPVTAFSQTPSAQITLEDALKRSHPDRLPTFWRTDGDELTSRLNHLDRGVTRQIGVSAGGHPLFAVEYGASEDAPGTANFNSAVGGREPSAYRDKTARTRPVVLFIGPVHGHETEGLVGLRNFIEVLETGKDLADREQPRLRELVEQCRIVLVPSGNPDAIARFTPRSLNGMTSFDARFWGQGTWADGTLCGWPEVKRMHPMPKEKISFLGLYFNDAGINIMHDEFFGAAMAPETKALLDLTRDIAPDVAVSLHAYEGPPMIEKPTYVPFEIQQAAQTIDQQCNTRLKALKLPYGSGFRPKQESGAPPLPFSLVSALYHVSGAIAFLHECPHGLGDIAGCAASCTDILDIEFILYESVLEYAINNRANVANTTSKP